RARAVGDERAGGARRDRAVPRLPAREDVIHDPGALRVRQELRSESDEPARRDPEFEPDPAAAVIHHLRHRPAARAGERDHDALEFLGRVDHEIFYWFDDLPLEVPRDDIGARDLQLVPLTPHHLDQDRQLQLAAPEHLYLFRRLGWLDA